MAKFVETEWEWATYDVWGNAKDGYEVNDVYRRSEKVKLRLTVKTYNVGTPNEFQSAEPSEAQIRRVFGCPRLKLNIDGDDLHVTVNRARDGYPIGEMTCVSHASLSPIRKEEKTSVSP